MNFQEFKNEVVKFAAEAEIEVYDLYYTKSSGTSIYAYKGEVDRFSDSTSIGICFRCVIDQKMGYASTQQFTIEEARRIVLAAKENASVLDASEGAVIFRGGESYETLPTLSENAVSVADLKTIAFQIEKSAMEADEHITSVPYAAASFFEGETALSNSYGLDLHSKSRYYMTVCQVVACEEEQKSVAFEYQISDDFSSIDVPKLVANTVEAALVGLGEAEVVSGSPNIVFENKMMCELLSTFSGIFSGDAANKGISLLKGREGECIASEYVTLIDDPRFPGTPFHSVFDDEGVPTQKHAIIHSGTLETLLYDISSGIQSDKQTTGNGAKSSYSGSVSVSPSNLVLERGDVSEENLLSKVKDGVFITSLKGLHSSTNAVTGDFSLEAKGRLIVDGKLSTGTKSFTVAGNFYDVLKNIKLVSDNLFFGQGVIAPSVLVEGLYVAG